MDSLRDFDADRAGGIGDDEPGASAAPPPSIGGDERRMHVRAYGHWVSLLRGRAFPAIADLDPAGIADFGGKSVLLDFTAGLDDPGIAFLGSDLRDECVLDGDIVRIGQVPPRSLLSRLTDRYLQIIANRAPVGFEAEFVNARGHGTMYRGILMPFSSTGEAIDFVYGVINWKELVDAGTQATLHREVAGALAAATRPPANAHAWADGPGAGSRAAMHDAVGRRAPLATVELAGDVPADRLLVLLARHEGDGRMAVLAALDDPELVAAAVHHAG